ncbi:hypothetical protein mru_0967 [Methanobrevibacter ruminantium M1]|uniref:Uncharacterized protein n=1 Tax=Methanobrevibacter ruminantium (strain ATCC 35063 / DSM 1093 / JCM 13430 / OCM 146 / M1) TaxID=634498 RepID=D3E2Q7_METRM|nr:hypothetical protein [Methanobrevibacter ruminantium]ADC46818.1 hypothetical protein mru_0967 [Methanobrevibacter ruminantium M1]
MIKTDNKGQITVELLLLLSFTFISIIALTNIISDANEVNIAMAAARNGAFEGASSNGLAIYPKDTFDNYSKDKRKEGLFNMKNIKIIKIAQTFKGKDNFNKTRIQLKVYASSKIIKTKEEKESAGDRINYNMRRAITNSFKTENISNRLFNPAFSDSYSFTTANVEWV